MIFKTSMDPYTRTTTHIVSIILAVAVIYLDYRFERGEVGAIASITSVILLYVGIFLSVTQNYKVTDGQLAIRSLLFSIRINLSDIKEVRLLEEDDIHLFRVMGLSGVFGYMGVFYSKECGKVLVYGRKSAGEKVAIELTNGKIYLLSPDDPLAFMQSLNTD